MLSAPWTEALHANVEISRHLDGSRRPPVIRSYCLTYLQFGPLRVEQRMFC